MAEQKILVVDDEPAILELVRFNLLREGFTVTTVEEGTKALEVVHAQPPDLLVLDLMLPGIDGLEVCRRLKQDPATRQIPIVMLTAKGEESDIVIGLELGADDYIPKPFSPRVLIARIKAVLRRQSAPVVKSSDDIALGGIVLRPGRVEVFCGEQKADLTATEFRILHLLMRKPGWVFTRSQIVEAARGENYYVTDRAVDVQIVGLRHKLGECGKLIETVRGIGYRFKD
jgi:two-component system, OmpR family, alkaline phosphatase synthesis response regulator PhoP